MAKGQRSTILFYIIVVALFLAWILQKHQVDAFENLPKECKDYDLKSQSSFIQFKKDELEFQERLKKEAVKEEDKSVIEDTIQGTIMTINTTRDRYHKCKKALKLDGKLE